MSRDLALDIKQARLESTEYIIGNWKSIVQICEATMDSSGFYDVCIAKGHFAVMVFSGSATGG